ncbi:hypothetical protein [Mycobacterium sp. SM3041]|uniref:hypothetical protein n=1 Tax=Mycobacterium sp. SM3041 TaxID=3114291 RepID=UPI003204AA4C
MDDSTAWPAELVTRIGQEISAARAASGISAVKLAAATEGLGVPIHRVAISRIEEGKQVVTVPELIALGMALEADWLGWLVRATNGLPVQVRRIDSAAYYQRLLAEVNDELKALEDSLFQAEQAPIRFQMADQLKDKIAADADRYRAMIVGLKERRAMILEELGRQA